MYKKLTKKAKILNLLTRGSNVTWNQLKTTYGLKSPRAMIDTIRRDGYVVYANKNAKARHAAIKANQTGSSAEGLDTKPSYGSGGFVTIENTTTYIQPVEV